MQVKHRLYNSILYIMLCGELDEHNSVYARNTLDALFSKTGFSQVIIDFSEMEFMDSTGIGVLIGRYKKLKDKNIPIFICNPSKHAEQIFVMTGIYNIMPKIN